MTDMLALINHLRHEHGVAPLRIGFWLTRYARKHSKEMAQERDLYHGDLAKFLKAHELWALAWGENVGAGTSLFIDGINPTNRLFDAFVASHDHRANMLNPIYRRVGIGNYISADGTLWQTQAYKA